MKKIIFACFCSFLMSIAFSQTLYFKGEWTKKGKAELFTGIFKITLAPGGNVSGELLWTYISTDSTDGFLLDHYKGKKGKFAIEFVQGAYDADTRDMIFDGTKKNDPDDVIGTDKYTLKLSADKQLLYGRTDDNGTNEGMFVALRMNDAAAQKAFAAAKAKLPKSN